MLFCEFGEVVEGSFIAARFHGLSGLCEEMTGGWEGSRGWDWVTERLELNVTSAA